MSMNLPLQDEDDLDETLISIASMEGNNNLGMMMFHVVLALIARQRAKRIAQDRPVDDSDEAIDELANILRNAEGGENATAG